MSSTTIVTRARPDHFGWSVKASGDNNIDLLHYVIKVEGLTKAIHEATRIATLIMKYEYEESDYTQISIRTWQVEVIMSAPTAGWWAKAQEELAAAVSAR